MKSIMWKNKIFQIVLVSILFLCSFFYFSFGYRYFNLSRCHYDEGAAAFGATRILEGDVPYRDFWRHSSPGEFYLLAAAFKIFGISLKVERLLAIGILALLSLCIYLLVSKLAPRKYALLAFFLCMAWLKTYTVYSKGTQPGILFSILTCFVTIHFIQSQRNKWLIVVGILAGITSLFRLDFVLYSLISVFLVVGLRDLELCADGNWGKRLRLVFIREGYIFSGTLLVLLPTIIYVIRNSAFRDLVSCLIIFPLTSYSKFRKLPYPPLALDTLVYYLPQLIFLLTAANLLIHSWKNKHKISEKGWFLLLFLLLGVGLLNYVRIRSCMSHLLYTMIPAIILFVLLYHDMLKRIVTKINKNYLWMITLLITFSVLFYPIKSTHDTLNGFAKKEARLDVERASGFYDGSKLAQSQATAIKYIQSRIKPDEKIFVGNTRHDRVVNSDVMFYFLANRKSATKFCELMPGITTTEDVQHKIIQDLKKNNVKYIVLWSKYVDLIEPNESSKSSGVLLLDNFIQENYIAEKLFGDYIVLSRIKK